MGSKVEHYAFMVLLLAVAFGAGYVVRFNQEAEYKLSMKSYARTLGDHSVRIEMLERGIRPPHSGLYNAPPSKPHTQKVPKGGDGK